MGCNASKAVVSKEMNSTVTFSNFKSDKRIFRRYVKSKTLYKILII